MKKWIIGGICAGLLSFGSVVYASDTIQALLFPVKIFIHGSKEGAQELTALNYNGSTYVPLRYVAEKFGAEVTYYEDTKLIDIDAKVYTFMKSDIGDGLPDHFGGTDPHQEMVVSIRTDKKVYSPGEPIILSIANNGPAEVTYGLSYELERRIDGEWYFQPLRQAWFSIGYSLKTGETGDQVLNLPVLEPGEYRIIKPLSAQATAVWSATLAAEFTVEE